MKNSYLISMALINYKNILVIIPGGIGNSVMFIPSLLLLKKYIGNVIIDILITAHSSSEIFTNIPCINNIYSIPKNNRFSFFKNLFNKYDLCIASMGINRFKSFILSKLLLSKKFICEKGNYNHLLNTHEVIRNFNIINQIINKPDEKNNLKLTYYLNKTNYIEAEDYYNSFIKNEFIGLGHGSGNFLKEKRWKIHNYISLAKKINDELNLKVVFFGNKSDGEILKNYSYLFNENIINCCGMFSLNTSAALIKKSKMFITNDCGLMHIAAANNIPVIAIFGPTIINKNKPFTKNSIIISKKYSCQPCYKFNKIIKCKNIKCIDDISVNEVFSKIMALKV